ncbi:unnamed protein product [Caretta caretta]
MVERRGIGDLPRNRSDSVCTKCKLVSILEKKVQGLEKQVSTLRCIRETEDFLDRHQDMLLWTKHSEDSEQAAQRGQKDGEEIWQHVTSRRRNGSVHCRYRCLDLLLAYSETMVGTEEEGKIKTAL